VELGAESFNVDNKYNGQPAGHRDPVATGANALATANAIGRASISDQILSAGPEGRLPNDTTPFIKSRSRRWSRTLFEGIALVFLVMYSSCRTSRDAIRRSPYRSCARDLRRDGALGFTINTLSMLHGAGDRPALDDAIVVVENVERVMTQEGYRRARPRAKQWADQRRAGWRRDGALGGIVPGVVFQRSVGRSTASSR